MLRDAFVIYDGFLHSPSPWTSTAYAARVAAHDAAAFFVVADNVTGQTGGNLTIQLEHSGDAVNWVNKSGAAEINIALGTGTTVAVGYDTGTQPTMQHGRLRITSTVATPEKVHVCVYVALRDLDPPAEAIPDEAPRPHKPDPDNSDWREQHQQHEAVDKTGAHEQGSGQGPPPDRGSM